MLVHLFLQNTEDVDHLILFIDKLTASRLSTLSDKYSVVGILL
jgi:hypothetical protein